MVVKGKINLAERLTLYLPASLKERVLTMAIKENCSMTDIVRRAIEAYTAEEVSRG